MGLCTAKDYGLSGDIYIILNVEAHDMVWRGGFVAQEKVLENELKKFMLEINQLETKDTQQVARVTTILYNIASFFHLTLGDL